MNKKLFFIPLAAALMASCSNDDLGAPKDPGATGETEIRYLAVNIVDNSVASRADYEYGNDDENKVKSIRFYLFKTDNTFFDYKDATAEPTSPGSENVEEKLQAVIVFEAKKANSTATVETPAKIVAVVNPPSDLLTSPTNIAALQEEIDNYGTTSAGSFIMSNSVYASGSNEIIAANITADNIKTSKAAALAQPVNVYVERVVAKVRVGIGTDLQDNLASSSNGFTGENPGNIFKITGGEQTIYGESSVNSSAPSKIFVKLIGWNVTGTAPQSRLVKKINAGWNFENWSSWNNSGYFRSFWAINPNGEEKHVNSQSDLTFDNFEAVTKEFYEGTPSSATQKENEFAYLQENAAWTVAGQNPTYPTKLIVAAQLVDANGTAVELGWYAGSYYLQNDLKQVLLNNTNIYKKEGENYTPVKVSDFNGIKFITTTEAQIYDDTTGEKKEGRQEDVKRYNAYGQVTNTTLTADTFYVKKTDGTFEETALDLEGLNNLLKDAGSVKVWTSGNTYYWLDIKHLATAGDNGTVGIVRNHIYDYTLGTITGFGVPVTKPGETIYPEKPEDPEYNFIAAELNILSWRVVSHTDEALGWE